jgi:excisionase family DNA binding protein
VRTPTFVPTSQPMSPNQVAQATSASRRTVMRAIEAGELEASRDNRNHWKITVQAVERWAHAQCAPTGQEPLLTDSLSTSAHPVPTQKEQSEELRIEREARRILESQAAELRGRLAVTEAERDRLHDIIKDLTTARNKKRSWWPF